MKGPIVGFRSPDQVDELVGAADLALDAATLDALSSLG